MLTLYDTKAGQAEQITGARRGELRVLICGPAAGRHPHLGDLRSYLLPDLIRRWAHRRGLQVSTYEAVAAAGEGTREALRADHAALNIHPPDRTFTAPEPAVWQAGFAAPGEPADGGPAFDIATGCGDGAPVPETLAAHGTAATGEVLFEGRDIAGLAEAGVDGADGVVWLSDVAGLGLDPLALRLAFLRYRYREPADLTWHALVAADRALRRWREQVAAWATEPSAPLVRSCADAVAAAFEDDLDSPAALRDLQALAADSAPPPGAKFETFAHLDQLFGLDLARDIGRY